MNVKSFALLGATFTSTKVVDGLGGSLASALRKVNLSAYKVHLPS